MLRSGSPLFELISTGLFFGLPPVAPFIGALLSFISRKSGYWRWPTLITYLALVFFGAIVITNTAYHIGEGYQNLPNVNWAVWAGLTWAAILTLPSALAVAIRFQSANTALVGGLIMLTTAYFLYFLKWQGDKYGIWFDSVEE